jgi:hypothetical protein
MMVSWYIKLQHRHPDVDAFANHVQIATLSQAIRFARKFALLEQYFTFVPLPLAARVGSGSRDDAV